MRKQSGPEEKDFLRCILLTTVLPYLTLAAFIPAQCKSQPHLVEPTGRETNCVYCKADFRSSTCFIAAFIHCRCFAIRRPTDYSTPLQRNGTPCCVHEYKDASQADTFKEVMGCARSFIKCSHIINLQVE